MRRSLVLLAALLGPLPAGVAAQSQDRSATSAKQGSAAEIPTPEARAAALRSQAQGVLAGTGPTELAVAQLTRAALLDPENPGTWVALAQGAGQIEERTPAALRWGRRQWGVALAGAGRAGAWTRGATARLGRAAGPWWAERSDRPSTWVGLGVLVVALAGFGVTRRRTARPRHPVCDTPAKVVLPRGQRAERAAPANRTPAAPVETGPRPSADERALLAYLTRRAGGAGGTAEGGILARA